MTYSPPKMKMTPTDIFLKSGRCSCFRTPSGMQRIATSKNKFVISYPSRKVGESRQNGGWVSWFQNASMGWHWNRTMNVVTINQTMHPVPVMNMARLTLRFTENIE